MVIGTYLERWYRAADGARVRFDQPTTVPRHGVLPGVFRLPHLITTHRNGPIAPAYLAFDPDPQDPRTVATVGSSFDAIA